MGNEVNFIADKFSISKSLNNAVLLYCYYTYYIILLSRGLGRFNLTRRKCRPTVQNSQNRRRLWLAVDAALFSLYYVHV